MGDWLIIRSWFRGFALIPVVFLLFSCSAIVNPDPDSLKHRDGGDADVLDKEDTMDIPDEGIIDRIEDEVRDIHEEDSVADPIGEDMQTDWPVEEDTWDATEEDLQPEELLDLDIAAEDAMEEDLTEEEGPYCGNDIKEDDEVCDGEDFGEETCMSQTGFIDGVLVCAEDCLSIDTSGCHTCGNGEIEGTEECDNESSCCAVCVIQPNFTSCDVVTDPDRDYDICIDGECRSPGCGDASCNPPGPHFTLPDTNQRQCYNNSAIMTCTELPCNADGSPAFCGQDAQYGWDTVNPDPNVRFERSVPFANQPVVLDNVTALMWQGCSQGQTGDISSCNGTASSDSSWADALLYCDGLSWGTYNDWRLPDRYELQSIVDYGRSSSPAINPTPFPNAPGDYFWSSSSSAGNAADAWVVNFGGGFVGSYDKIYYPYAVRCVRRGQPTVDRFARSGTDEPIVTDNVTGLMWQGCPAGLSHSDCSTGSFITRTWQGAPSYCEGLSWGGHEDWYLPSVIELSSIGNDHRTSPAIDTDAFPNTPSNYFWSSSSSAFNASNAWYVDLGLGNVYYGGVKAGSGIAVRCVRRGP